jgi:amino acid permease
MSEPKDQMIKLHEATDSNAYMEKIIDSVNITLTSYGFIINLFPIAQTLKHKTKANVMKSVFIALCFCFSSYFILTKLAINIYGVHNIKQSIFENLKEDSSLMSIGIRMLFLVIFLCNIPYLFYPGKLSVLNALQEYRLRCFSSAIENTIALKKYEYAEGAGTPPFIDSNDNPITPSLDGQNQQLDSPIDVINDCDD